MTSTDLYLGLGTLPGELKSFNGLIDEFAIFDHALTVDEIFAIYSADVLGKDTKHPYFGSWGFCVGEFAVWQWKKSLII
jgi:hypothetical protein